MRIAMRYGPLLAALAAASGVGAAGLAAFENRLKHLKRNGYPAGAKLGKTGRYDYTAADIVGLAAAVRLMDAYVMPTTAIQLIEAGSAAISMLALDRLSEFPPPTRVAGGSVEEPDAIPRTDRDGSQSPNPFAPRRYAFFPGIALSSLGTRAPGAGRYDAPVDTAILIEDLDKAPGASSGSGILLDGAATFDRLIGELQLRGIHPDAVKASLLADLSPAEAAAADRDVDRELDEAHRHVFWHLDMLLRLIDRWPPEDGTDEAGRLIVHHARSLLTGTAARDVAAIMVDAESGTTVGETVLAILEEKGFPLHSLLMSWTVPCHIDMLDRIGAPREDRDYARRWLIEQIPRLATTLPPGKR